MYGWCVETSEAMKGRIGAGRIGGDDVQVLDVEAEKRTEATAARGGFLGREKQFVSSNMKAGIDDRASQLTAQDEESQGDIECPNCKEIIPES